jgi:hypothetical protein
MAEATQTNGRTNLIGWIAGPLVGTVLGVFVSEFKDVSDHSNRIGILETSMFDLRRRVDSMDQKLDRLLELYNPKH